MFWEELCLYLINFGVTLEGGILLRNWIRLRLKRIYSLGTR
jgi:hypothetical protein